MSAVVCRCRRRALRRAGQGDLKPDNVAVKCLSPSRVVLTEGWQAGGGGFEIPPELVEPPEAMGNAAVLLAGQNASGITGTIQRSEELFAS